MVFCKLLEKVYCSHDTQLKIKHFGKIRQKSSFIKGLIINKESRKTYSWNYGKTNIIVVADIRFIYGRCQLIKIYKLHLDNQAAIITVQSGI